MTVLRTSTAARRALVIGFGLVVVALVVLSATRDDADRTWEWPALIGVAVLIWLVARHAVADVVEGPAERLGGRELAIRHRAVRAGFMVLWVGVLLLAFLLSTAGDEPPLAVRGGELLYVLAVAGAAMPTMLVCWTAPALDPGDG